MRRVLHLTDSWGPGGAETVFADLAAGLDPSRFESFIGLPRASDWLHDEIRRRGLAPLVYPSNGSFDLAHLRRLVVSIRRLRIDVIQAHTFGTSVYASAAGLATRTPVVCTLHGRVDLALGQRHRALKWQAVRSGAARIVCVSEALRNELLTTTRSLRPKDVSVIYNGVNVHAFHPGANASLRQSLNGNEADIIIGAVGNLRRIKGYEVLVEAAAALLKRGVGAQFVVVGQSGNEVHQELEAQARQHGIENHFHFLGFRDDAAELYRGFDAYVLSSHSEGFPLSTIQALASGLPVVATRCGGPEEMIQDGLDGLLVEKGSPAAIADALATLATDPGLRARMGRAARETAVAKFSTQAMVSQYEELYEELAPSPVSRSSTARAASTGARP